MRCTGHCCRRFYLPIPPCVVAMAALAAQRGRGEQAGPRWRSPVASDLIGHYRAPQALGSNTRLTFASRDEAIQIAGMVRFVASEPTGSGLLHFYDCVHLREDGNCGIYELRPAMCRDYPYERKCSIAGCTLAHEVTDPGAGRLEAAGA